MSLTTQSIPSLTGGVSQYPPALRLPSQVAEQINMLSHPTQGVMKRPPSVRAATLFATAPTGSAFMHTVNRSQTDRFRVVIMNGAISIFDAVTNAPVSVASPGGLDYLTSADPEHDFRAVTVGDDTFIVNRSVVVAAGTQESPAAKNEALLYIAQADYSTFYQVVVNGITVNVTTTDGSTPADRGQIGTQFIAASMATAIQANADLSDFVVKQYGSTLHVAPTDGAPFTIAASDGLADQAIIAIMGTVQRFDQLPTVAPNGFIVQITNAPVGTNPLATAGEYYVQYNDFGTPSLAGVWQECVAPGVLIGLDPTTMPYRLAIDGEVLDGVTASLPPAGPVVSSENAATVTDGWTIGGGSGSTDTSSAATSVPRTLVNYEESAYQVIASFTGGPVAVNVYYDFDTTRIHGGTLASVQLWASKAPSLTPLAVPTVPLTDPYWDLIATTPAEARGFSAAGQVFAVNGSWAQHTQFLVRLVYSTGTTPDADHLAYVQLHGVGEAGFQPIQITAVDASILTFLDTQVYPTGTVFVVTAGADTETYALTTDMTGAAIATAIAAKYVSTVTATVLSSGVIKFTATAVPALSYTATLDDTKYFYNAGLGLGATSLAGLTIRNLSDGSSGTITSNTDSSIFVTAGLSGGVNNKFSPHDLIKVGEGVAGFTFGPSPWLNRTVGDTLSNPDPSFVGQTIMDIFFTKNRLGFIAAQNVVMSGAANQYNFYRESAYQLFPDDLVDIQSALGKVNQFHSVTEWAGNTILWTDEAQVLLDGQPAMSPMTASLRSLSSFNNDPTVRPFVAGRHVFFTRIRGGMVQAWEYAVVNTTGTPDATESTAAIPTYIKGNPLQVVGDAANGFMAIRTDAAANILYVQHYSFDNQQKVQEAWGSWVFNAANTLLAMDVLDGTLALVFKRAGKIYLETINLVVAVSEDPGSYLDARTGPAGHYVGDLYNSYINLSPFYQRILARWGNNQPTVTGRTSIRYAEIHYHNSFNFTVTVTPGFGTASTYSYVNSVDTGDGEFRFPVQAVNTNVVIQIGNTAADGFRLSGASYEAIYTNRAQRV